MRQVQNIYIDWSGDGCVTNSDRALPPIDAWPPLFKPAPNCGAPLAQTAHSGHELARWPP